MERKSEIGASIVIRGEVLANEDLIVAGRIEGSVVMKEHRLTVQKDAMLKATIQAREIVVSGGIVGTIVAVERTELLQTAEVNGEVTTPVLVMADGAGMMGRVEMPKTKNSKLSLAS